MWSNYLPDPVIAEIKWSFAIVDWVGHTATGSKQLTVVGKQSSNDDPPSQYARKGEGHGVLCPLPRREGCTEPPSLTGRARCG